MRKRRIFAPFLTNPIQSITSKLYPDLSAALNIALCFPTPQWPKRNIIVGNYNIKWLFCDNEEDYYDEFGVGETERN